MNSSLAVEQEQQALTTYLYSVLLLACLFFFSLYLAWQLLSSQNFLYGYFYDHTELAAFIDHYAPQNFQHPEFALTERQERIRIFSEILLAVNSQGEGLDTIEFHDGDGSPLGVFLNQAERDHLMMVSSLVSTFKWLALFSFFPLALLVFFLAKKPYSGGSMNKVLITYGVFFLFVAVLVLLLGPVEVFSWLHEIFFPKGHQWFFYYQESLMTTLMMAPKLFLYLFAAWMLVTLAVFSAILICLVVLWKKRA